MEKKRVFVKETIYNNNKKGLSVCPLKIAGSIKYGHRRSLT